MIKAPLIFTICFLTAFGAGVSATILWERSQNYGQDGWLKDLHLSQDQREKIKAIWTDAMKAGTYPTQRDKREALQRERDEALQALISSDQKDRFDEILRTYRTRADELSAESKKAREEAYERTKAVLTDSQRAIYEELRKKRQESKNKSRTETSPDSAAEKVKNGIDGPQQKGPSQQGE